MPRGGRRPGAGAPKGNLNAYKHGRNSRTRDRMLEVIARDPEALALVVKMSKEEKKRHERQVEQAKVGMTALFNRVEELHRKRPRIGRKINRTIPPAPRADQGSER